MKQEKLDPWVSESESAKKTKLQESNKTSPYSDSMDGISVYKRDSFPVVSKL